MLYAIVEVPHREEKILLNRIMYLVMWTNSRKDTFNQWLAAVSLSSEKSEMCFLRKTNYDWLACNGNVSCTLDICLKHMQPKCSNIMEL